MEQTIGFIGSGNMAQAMMGGMIRSELVPASQIIASARTEATLSRVAAQFGIQTNLNNRHVAREADILILAIKPHDYQTVLEEIKHDVSQEAIIIPIAPGIRFVDLQQAFEQEMKVVLAMPNTPSLIEAGMSALCPNDKISSHELDLVMQLFGSIGEVDVLSEKQMEAVPAISSSAPAYVYMMIEAMADGGVAQGLGREQAYRLAAQTVLGAAKMVLDTGKHPGELKDNVTSPAGTTIAAVATLEQSKFRGTIMAAMQSCTDRVMEMQIDYED
ncbi:pyrroline-5-carboxylate reductase [Pontibacillus litoralis]|uniref:Pyrroline-5-carboxylate reductase n=1 Tax=Pontibacillus litoralis JSM 072002 TaxID=1385512 RepID=A0A0A5G7S3_9BACI|nr:pyrroline-5-carboxylate reductase [Pontibacillus litoralis]KGX87228.1 pyrroline-5-carboxylate reductase [Pontibacillus litoralis JSM 072002]